MPDGTVQPDIASEIQQAVRDAMQRVPAIVVVGLIVIGVFTMGLFSRRKR